MGVMTPARNVLVSHALCPGTRKRALASGEIQTPPKSVRHAGETGWMPGVKGMQKKVCSASNSNGLIKKINRVMEPFQTYLGDKFTSVRRFRELDHSEQSLRHSIRLNHIQAVYVVGLYGVGNDCFPICCASEHDLKTQQP